jgi:putative SOS response-associated peptidase YedK
MCGRYYVEMTDSEMQNIAEQARHNATTDYRDISIKTVGEIFPTDTVPVQISEKEYVPMQWGFTLAGNKLLINARYETFTQKPTFKNCFRCLIPASGYFEWKRDTNPKEKYAFSQPNELLLLSGLYRTEKDKPIPNFVILTREAVGVAADIHHRMPVIIPHENISEWFSGEFQIDKALTDIECSAADMPEGQIRFEF